MHSKSKAPQNSLKQLRPFYMQNLESRKKVMVKKRCTKDRLTSNMDGSVRRKFSGVPNDGFLVHTTT